MKDLGADATFNYKVPLQEQLTEIKRITGGKYPRCYDASAMASETGMEALAQGGDSETKAKIFATTNDW